ncbi:MAG: 3-dehydroquinate synthase [Bacillota bacterium]|jgi:3-dehydroquinate synthase
MTYVIEMSNYQIQIGHNLLKKAGSFLQEFSGRTICVITDDQVSRLYGEDLRVSLVKAGLDVEFIVVPAGETSKSRDMLFSVLEKLAQLGLSRDDLIAALGGGVIGDLAGLAAATYMRGVKLIQIPTTLLSQVDSSVGGKVAVDLPQGKNLMGAFHDPHLVLADTQLLETLPPRELAAGMAEVIKYGCIKDEKMFKMLERGGVDLDDLVTLSVAIKKAYVEEDPQDQKDIRAELNFGHTLGHALENALDYHELLHGEAVGVGMIAAATVGEHLGLTEANTACRITEVLEAYNVKLTVPPVDRQKVMDAIKLDKKGKHKMVLLSRIGSAFIHQIGPNDLFLLTEGCSND